MPENLHQRLKRFLLDSITRDHDADAWNYYKALDLDENDLEPVILYTPFAREAWTLLQQQTAAKETLLNIAKNAEDALVKTEAEARLMQYSPFDNAMLDRIVSSLGSDAAARMLLAQAPNNEQLITIICHAQGCCDQAAAELLRRSPDNDELVEIICYSGLKQIAWERLIQQAPSHEQIVSVIEFSDYDDIAWDYFVAQKPPNEALHYLIYDFAEVGGKKQLEAARYVLSQQPSVNDLVDIIENNLYADEAMALLEQKTLDESDLDYIIWKLVRRESVKKNEAALLCLRFSPDTDKLWDLFSYTDCKEEVAARLIETSSLSLRDLEDLLVAAPIPSVVEAICRHIRFDRSQINEAELLQQIATTIRANPDLLDVNHWHKGDRHCFGGWAITLCPAGQELERRYSSEIAAGVLLPEWVGLFFAGREEVLERLKAMGR